MLVQISQQFKDFSIAPQICVEDVAEIAQLGFKTIINCRPDGEGGSSQPPSEQIKVAAEKLGLAYYYIPVIPNNIQVEKIEEFESIYASAAKPVLGFCRTGNRVAKIFELAQVSK